MMIAIVNGKNHLGETTGDIVHVQQALRDSDLRSVIRYVKTSEKMLKEKSIGVSDYIANALMGII